jgi:hypothetical protein
MAHGEARMKNEQIEAATLDEVRLKELREQAIRNT